MPILRYPECLRQSSFVNHSQGWELIPFHFPWDARYFYPSFETILCQEALLNLYRKHLQALPPIYLSGTQSSDKPFGQMERNVHLLCQKPHLS